MSETLTIALSEGKTGWVKFKCRAFECNYYEVGMFGMSAKSAEVKWPDGAQPSSTYAADAGMSQDQAVLLARNFEEREYKQYLEWHNENAPKFQLGAPRPQERGLNL